MMEKHFEFLLWRSLTDDLILWGGGSISPQQTDNFIGCVHLDGSVALDPEVKVPFKSFIYISGSVQELYAGN